MEEAAELANYLPLSFKSPEGAGVHRVPVGRLRDQLHARQVPVRLPRLPHAHDELRLLQHLADQADRARDFAKGLIGFGKDIEKSFLEATSPFVFSTVNERSILRFLKLIACDNGKIGTYAKLVDDRNETAHPNGNIFFSTEAALDPRSPRSCASWTRSRPTPGPSSSTATASSCSKPRPRRTRVSGCRRPDPRGPHSRQLPVAEGHRDLPRLRPGESR